MSFIRSIQLTSFRCYDGARIDALSAGPVVLHGPNGAGKTNLLEAVSLLSPGRGLRGAKIEEIQKQQGAQSWSVSAVAMTSYGEIRLGTGADPKMEKRIVRINGETAKGQNALAEYLACVWLTPQMDRLFLDAASSRRKFLDRLVFAFDPGHAGRITRYENAMSQRAKILRETPNPDAAWLNGLEAQMAETGVAIAAARLEFSQRLQKACDCVDMLEENLFPRARIAVKGTVEDLLRNAPALEVEDMFRYQLSQTRLHDATTGGAATGPHKSDLIVIYAAKNMMADQCSTGEQKALLIGMVLAHARMITAERGAPPILLLDEVAAHLDENRRAGLYELLIALKAQVWLTGTDQSLFKDLAGKAAFFTIDSSKIIPAEQSRAA